MYHTLSTLNSYESKVMAQGGSTCATPPILQAEPQGHSVHLWLKRRPEYVPLDDESISQIAYIGCDQNRVFLICDKHGYI